MGGGITSRDLVVTPPGSVCIGPPTTFSQMRELVEERAGWVDDPDEPNKSDFALKMLVSNFYYGEAQDAAAKGDETAQKASAAAAMTGSLSAGSRRRHHHTEVRRLVHRGTLGCCG